MAQQRYTVELSQGSARDLEELCDYLSELRAMDDAVALLDAFVEKIAGLETFPHRGAVPRELQALGIAEYRQVLLSHFRLIYRVDGPRVRIVVIADGRRDMQALLERRLLAR